MPRRMRLCRSSTHATAKRHSGSTVADANGRWSFTPKDELEYGNWDFRAKTTNGNYSADYALRVVEHEEMVKSYDFESIIPET